MKIRFPLYAKVLFWFFLNLVFLLLVFYGLFKVQFRIGLDSLLLGRTGDRMQAVSDIIGAELGDTPTNEWDALLDRFSSAYKVKFLLLRPTASEVAGERIDLPPEVVRRDVAGTTWATRS